MTTQFQDESQSSSVEVLQVEDAGAKQNAAAETSMDKI
jgi:hypothetical protein